MKILYVTTSHSDYLANNLREGFLEIKQHEIKIFETKDGDIVSEDYLKWADKIIYSTGVKVPTINNPQNYQHKIVIVDGSDWSHKIVEIPHLLYFKRECLNNESFPINFCARRKQWDREIIPFSDRTIDVLYSVHLPCNSMRKPVLDALEKLKSKYNVICQGTSSGTGRIDFEEYLKLLSKTKIGVSVHGAGQDCIRYWEVPACGALLLSQKTTIKIVNDLNKIENLENQEAAEFTTIEEMINKIDYYLSNQEKMSQIANRGREKILKFHTSELRAMQLIEQIDCGFTENWYGDNQVLELQKCVDMVKNLDGDIIEIGCWEGKSAVGLVNKSYPQKVITVDTWQGNVSENPNHPTVTISKQRDVFGRFKQNMKMLTKGNVDIRQMDCFEFLNSYTGKIKICHIDACHHYADVKRTIDLCKEKLVVNGILCGDDIASADKTRKDLGGGVEQAVIDSCVGYEKIGNFWKWQKLS